MRYTVRAGIGGEWEIWDTKRSITVASGLDLHEATQGATNRNTEGVDENTQKAKMDEPK